jgi:predicted SnoaL-like aldol condensation-catalyzing enzyme
MQRGKDGTRQAFTKLLGEVPQATWDIKTTIYEGDVLLLEWGAEGGGNNRIVDGIDTFVFRDGRIRSRPSATPCSLLADGRGWRCDRTSSSTPRA